MGKTSCYNILGAFDSGTNLFSLMAGMNFPSAKQWNGSFWKHSTLGAQKIKDAMAQMASVDQPLIKVVLVIMVRSPISQFVSWRKAPYNLEYCLNRTLESMGSPCIGFTDNVDVSNQLYYPR